MNPHLAHMEHQITSALETSYRMERELRLVTTSAADLARNPLIHLAHKITCRIPVNVGQDLMIQMLLDAMGNARLDSSDYEQRVIHIDGNSKWARVMKPGAYTYWTCTRLVYVVVHQLPLNRRSVIHNGHENDMNLGETAMGLQLCAEEDRTWLEKVRKLINFGKV